MANEFKVRKGLLVEASGSTSGSTLVDVQGTVGQVFSVTDNLIGSIFSVNDISGIPLLDVNSNGTVVGGISTEITTGEIREGVSSVYGDLEDWTSNYVSGEIMKNQLIGESVTFGECLSLSNGSGWVKADQADTDNAKRMLGIALQTKSSGNIDVLIRGFVETDQVENTSPEIGTPMYLREGAAGDMSAIIPTSGAARLVGYCFVPSSVNSVFILRFDPDNTWVEL